MAVKYILVDAWNTLVTETGINTRLVSLLDSFETPKIIVTNANEEEKVKFGIVNMPYPVFSLAHQPNKTDPLYFKKLLLHLSVTLTIKLATHKVFKRQSIICLNHFYGSYRPFVRSVGLKEIGFLCGFLLLVS